MLYNYFYDDNWVPWPILFGQSGRGQLMPEDTSFSALLLDGEFLEFAITASAFCYGCFLHYQSEVATSESCSDRILLHFD